MSSIGVMKAQLFHLEKKAQRLEAIVLKELYWLEYLDEDEADRLEATVLRKLHRLDCVQDEIDQTIGKLKEAGEFDHILYVQMIKASENVEPPKISASQKKAKAAADKKKAAQEAKAAKQVQAQAAWQARLEARAGQKVADAWKAALDASSDTGIISVKVLTDCLGMPTTTAQRNLQKWRNDGRIVRAGKDGVLPLYKVSTETLTANDSQVA